MRFPVPRMQTNAAWLSPAIRLVSGNPQTTVDPTAWTIQGKAAGKLTTLPLTIANGRLAIVSQRLKINLTAEDCAALGAGRVTIEVLRLAPAPAPRPLFRFAIENNAGV